jgi:hypothetical protein
MSGPNQPEPPPALPPGYHIGINLDNSPGANINVGQEGRITVQHQTWPQKLASHTVRYWLFHFVLALGAVIVWEFVVWAYHWLSRK